MTKTEINQAKDRYFQTNGGNLDELLFAFFDHPEWFDRNEAYILDGLWDSVEAQQQALWHYYKGRRMRIVDTIKNL